MFDPVAEARAWLMAQPALAGVVIGSKVPTPDLPVQLVRLTHTGSRQRSLAHRDSLLTIECWHLEGEQKAAGLMDIVVAALDAWEYVPIHNAWDGPYLQPDPGHGVSRAVATVIIRHRTD